MDRKRARTSIIESLEQLHWRRKGTTVRRNSARNDEINARNRTTRRSYQSESFYHDMNLLKSLHISDTERFQFDNPSSLEWQSFSREVTLKPGEVREDNKHTQPNKVVILVDYLSSKHEVLVQFAMLLPLILMSLYILLVEGGNLVKENSSS